MSVEIFVFSAAPCRRVPHGDVTDRQSLQTLSDLLCSIQRSAGDSDRRPRRFRCLRPRTPAARRRTPAPRAAGGRACSRRTLAWRRAERPCVACASVRRAGFGEVGAGHEVVPCRWRVDRVGLRSFPVNLHRMAGTTMEEERAPSGVSPAVGGGGPRVSRTRRERAGPLDRPGVALRTRSNMPTDTRAQAAFTSPRSRHLGRSSCTPPPN